MSGVRYSESGKTFEPGDIYFRSDIRNGHREMELSGPYLSAVIRGDFSATGIVEGLHEMTRRALPDVLPIPASPPADETFSWYVHLEKTEELFQIFIPDIRTHKPISLSGIYSGRERQFSMALKAEDLTAYGVHFSTIAANATLADSSLQAGFESKKVQFTETGHMDEMHLDMYAARNQTEIRFNYQNKDSLDYGANVIIQGAAKGLLAMEWKIDSSSKVVLADTAWVFNHNHRIGIDTQQLVFDNVQVTSGQKYLSVNGVISDKPEDQLGISFTNFNLANISRLFPQEDLNMSGNISGFLKFGQLADAPRLDADLSLENLAVNGEKIGDGQFRTHWNPETQQFNVNMDMRNVGKMKASKGKVFLITGTVSPYKTDSVFDLHFETEGLKLMVAEPFINEYVENIKGQLMGELHLAGTPAHPLMSGNMRLDSVSFKVKYLNTSFQIHRQKLRIENDFFGFDQLAILDEEGNKASANITVYHDNFKNINFDVSLDTLYRFLCLNTTETDNPYYYGKAYLSGHMSLSGNMENMWIEIVGATNEKSNFYLPLYSDEVSENEFITFVNPSINDTLREDYKVDFSGINMNIKLNVHPATEATLLFDPVTDDALKAKGSGNLEMNIDPAGNFAMNGLYNIISGTYKFTAERLLTKTFKLKEGGTIRWNGDPLGANLDVTATYKVRAPLGSLFGDPNQTQKVTNECLMNLIGPLEKPALSFGIELLNVDESVKEQVRSQMPTQDDIDKQFFNLMLFSRYAPASEGISSDGLVSTSSSDLLAGQINSILSKFDNRIIDFGVSEIKSSQVEVEFSKSLFNDRLQFESNVGMAGNSSNQSTDGSESGQNPQTTDQAKNSFIGDFTLEYLIREDGKLRAKVFSRTETRTIEYESSGAQTQGVGLFYRTEFNSYGELMRKMLFWKNRGKKNSKKKTPKPEATLPEQQD
jgi:hypothetical protein